MQECEWLKKDNANNYPLVNDSIVESTCVACGSRRAPLSPTPGSSCKVSFIDITHCV